MIIRQGDDGDRFFVMAAGTADIFVDGRLVSTVRANENENEDDEDKQDSAKEKAVRKKKDGNFFGELALLYDAPRAASVVVTSENVLTWALDRLTFKKVRGIGSRQYMDR